MPDNKITNEKKKFSLIELLMIIMIVGIIFTLIIPMRQDKKTKDMLSEAIRNLQIIARADVAFKEDPEKGDGIYMFDHIVVQYHEPSRDDRGNQIPAYESGDDLLNIKDQLQKKNKFFYFDYSVNDTTVVAISNKNFGKSGAKVFYYLPSGPWGIGKDDLTKSMIDPNWLP